MPVAALFETLRDGATIEQFLEWFPGVERWQAESDSGPRDPGCEGRGGLKILFGLGLPVPLRRRLAIMVLLAASWPRIRQRVDDIRAIVDQIGPGQYMEVPI